MSHTAVKNIFFQIWGVIPRIKSASLSLMVFIGATCASSSALLADANYLTMDFSNSSVISIQVSVPERGKVKEIYIRNHDGAPFTPKDGMCFSSGWLKEHEACCHMTLTFSPKTPNGLLRWSTSLPARGQ